jgi:low affinity Fe/Cu permease
MKRIYFKVERSFEGLANNLTRLFGNSVVFLMAILLIAYWLLHRNWASFSEVDSIRDIILSITFLSFFIIQKAFSRFSKALQLKLDELVATHDKARNHLIKAEEKTEEELEKLSQAHKPLIKSTDKSR